MGLHILFYEGLSVMLSGQDAHPAIDDYSYRNPNRFSRLKALQDLLIRFQKAKLASKDMDVNIAQLVKAWGWSRPAVLAFVDQLQKYEILEVCNMVTSKVVHLKPSIFSSGLSPTPGG